MNDFGNHNMSQWNSNYNGGYNMYGLQSSTNVTYVTSVEEALFRANQRNSEMVFFHQDKPVFYRVKVDEEGKKFWAQFYYGKDVQDASIPITKADLQGFEERLKILEEKLLSKGDEA